MPNFLTSELKNRTENHNPESTEMVLCSHCGRESQIQPRVELVDLREKYEKLLKEKTEAQESFPGSNLFTFEPESSIGSEDFESFPNEAELALESLKIKHDAEKSQVDEELGSPASQSSTKSCVVLKGESEEEEDVSVETIAIPEYGPKDFSRASSDDIDESRSEAAPASHSAERVLLPTSIPGTGPTGIKSPGEVASTTDVNISPSREDPKESESSPPVLPPVSIAKVGPTELVPVISAVACLDVPNSDQSMPEPDPAELPESEPESLPSVPLPVLMAEAGVKEVFEATEVVSAEQANHHTSENAPGTEINTACSGLLPIEADHALEVKDDVSSQETPSAKDASTRDDEVLVDGDIELDHPKAIPATEEEHFLDLEEDHIPSVPLSSSPPSPRMEYTKTDDPAEEGNVLQEGDIQLGEPETNPGIEDKKLLDLEEGEMPSPQLPSFLPPSTENSTRGVRPSVDNDVLVKGDGEIHHPEIISVVEKDHVHELEEDKAEASSVPLPISALSSPQKLSDSEDPKKGAYVHAEDDQNKSKIDEETALFQETQNNADIKETGESESDKESPVRPSFDIKMKYKAIEAPEPDEESPGRPVFDRDMTSELSLEGTHSHLLKQVKRPFVLRLFRGRQLDQRLIHSDHDISETMQKICQEDIDAFDIEEVIAEGPTPTPQYAEFFTEEDGKMHLTPIMELFSLLDYLKNKSAENSEEQDGEPIDQETLAAIIADDVAREKIRMGVPEPMRESTDLMRAFGFSATSAKPLTAQAGSAAPCAASSSGTSPRANEETAKDSPTVVDKAPTQELACPVPNEQSTPNQSPTQVDLSWMGESPDQNQLQRLVRFMNVLTNMIAGYSCPESK